MPKIISYSLVFPIVYTCINDWKFIFNYLYITLHNIIKLILYKNYIVLMVVNFLNLMLLQILNYIKRAILYQWVGSMSRDLH